MRIADDGSFFWADSRILVTDKLGNSFNQTTVPLKYTPRRLVVHAPTRHLVVIETDHRTFSPAERARRVQQNGGGGGAASAGDAISAPAAAKVERDEDDMETEDAPPAPPPVPQPPAPAASAGTTTTTTDGVEEKVEEFDVKAPEGTWASCIRVVDPAQAATYSCIDLTDNEAAFTYVLGSDELKRSFSGLAYPSNARSALAPSSFLFPHGRAA